VSAGIKLIVWVLLVAKVTGSRAKAEQRVG
jgi:hypothetical protein